MYCNSYVSAEGIDPVQTDASMDGWINGWIDGWIDGWMDGWMDGRTIMAWQFHNLFFNPTALRMAKTLWSFGCSECNRVNILNIHCIWMMRGWLRKPLAVQYGVL